MVTFLPSLSASFLKERLFSEGVGCEFWGVFVGKLDVQKNVKYGCFRRTLTDFYPRTQEFNMFNIAPLPLPTYRCSCCYGISRELHRGHVVSWSLAAIWIGKLGGGLRGTCLFATGFDSTGAPLQ